MVGDALIHGCVYTAARVNGGYDFKPQIELIKEKADSLGLNISQLEAKAGIANGTIGGWKNSKPYAETLAKVAKVLGCTIDELMLPAAG